MLGDYAGFDELPRVLHILGFETAGCASEDCGCWDRLHDHNATAIRLQPGQR